PYMLVESPRVHASCQSRTSAIVQLLRSKALGRTRLAVWSKKHGSKRTWCSVVIARAVRSCLLVRYSKRRPGRQIKTSKSRWVEISAAVAPIHVFVKRSKRRRRSYRKEASDGCFASKQ